MDPNELIKTGGVSRSRYWTKVRKEYLKKHSFCCVCGGKKKLQVHHIKPFHLYPELELEESNLITLCEFGKNGIICHLAVGHLGSYRSINENVLEDSKFWLEKIVSRPRLF